MDDRAQSIGILRLFLGLAVGAIMFWIVSLVTEPLFEHTRAGQPDQISAQGTEWLSTGVEHMPVLFLGVSFFGLIAYSVYSREVVR